MTTRELRAGALIFALCAALFAAAFRAVEGAALAFRFAGHDLSLAEPRALAALAVLPFLAWGTFVTLTEHGALQRLLSLLARSALVALLALALARPERVVRSSRVSAVALFDVSDSIADADLARASKLLAELRAAQGSHALASFSVAGEASAIGASTTQLARATGEHGASTDLERAIQLAYGALEPGTVQRIAIVSDGRQTRGELLRQAARARRAGVRIDYVPLTAGRPAEVAVRNVELPATPEVGRSFEVRAHVYASAPAKARVRLYQDGALSGLDATREVELKPGDNEVAWKALSRLPGEVVYRAVLEPLSPDHFATNNEASASVKVIGRPSVLFIDREPAQARHAAQALGVADFEVDLRAPYAAPRTLAELVRYDFVILSDVPRDALAGETEAAFERYVRDYGGAFMMVGGEQSFGLGGYAGSKLESLLPVRMDSERRRDEHSLALALVIDCSGSMSGAKIELAKDAARATAELLGASDSIGVIGFSGTPERRVRMQSATNRLRIHEDIARITAQGGTAIFPALDMALSDLISVRARIKHVILLTDGQTQESGLPELTQAMRAEGITITTVGLGSDVNRRLLEQIASLGGGRSYLTTDPENVPRIFMRETSTVAHNSVVEEATAALAVEPADFLKGIDVDRAPLLRGYVATQPRTRPAQVVLASEQGEPILARWRVGLGWSLAFTSDLKPRWARDWLRWQALPKLLGQLVREHMRKDRAGELPLTAELHGDEVHIAVDALDAEDRFLNGLESKVTLEGPLGAKSSDRITRTVQLTQRAPGYYTGKLALDRVGTFSLAAEHTLDGALVARGDAQLARPYPAEYATFGDGTGLLRAAAQATGGMELERAADLFAPRDQEIQHREPMWPTIVLGAIAWLLIDLLLRRARLPWAR
jgi:Ca-activated chloride channel family protein